MLSCLVAGKEAQEALTSQEGLFQPGHKISVLIAEAIQKSSPEKWKESSGFSVVPASLKLLLESLAASKLNADQLSELPKESVLIYSQFLIFFSHVSGIVLLYMTILESEKPPVLTAE